MIRLLVVLLFSISCNFVHGQFLAPSGFNIAGGSGISPIEFDWSAGELASVATRTGVNIMLTDGLMQPEDITISRPKPLTISAQLKLFPNPASEILELEIWDFQGEIQLELFDITGKSTGIQTSFEVQPGLIRKQIPVTSLSAGVYAVKLLTKTGHSVQSFSQKITILR